MSLERSDTISVIKSNGHLNFYGLAQILHVCATLRVRAKPLRITYVCTEWPVKNLKGPYLWVHYVRICNERNYVTFILNLLSCTTNSKNHSINWLLKYVIRFYILLRFIKMGIILVTLYRVKNKHIKVSRRTRKL